MNLTMNKNEMIYVGAAPVHGNPYGFRVIFVAVIPAERSDADFYSENYDDDRQYS